MYKGNTRHSSKKAGLSVRYCFDGQEHPDGKSSGDEDLDATEDSRQEGPEFQSSSLSYTSGPEGQALTIRKPPHHLPRPNHWFQSGTDADFRRRTRMASTRLRRRSFLNRGGGRGGVVGVHGFRGDDLSGGEWQGEGEIDPGFFVTSKVTQPPKEDTISWDSSPYTSSSDEDIRDNFSRHNRTRPDRSRESHATWAFARNPVPPPARNLTANKAEESNIRTSVTTSGTRDKKVENTYRLEPKPGQQFIWFRLKRPMVSLVDQLLDDFSYNAKSGPAVTRKLCEVIMRMAKKNFDWPRYRYVCHVVLAQLNQQGIMIADRCLWSTSVDNVASYVHKTKTVVCVVTFHAMYYE